MYMYMYSPRSPVLELRDRAAIPDECFICWIVAPYAVSIAPTTVDEPVWGPGGRWRAANLAGHWYPPLPTGLVAVDEIGNHARPLPEGLVLGREAACENRFGADFRPLSSRRGSQAALNLSYRSDSVTRD